MMKIRSILKYMSACLASAGMLVGPGNFAQAQSSGSQFDLGKNAAGDRCTASSNWTDPSFTDDKLKFADAYSVNCRGAATQSIARVRVFPSSDLRSEFSTSLSCGAETSIELDEFGSTTAKRCVDKGLGFTSVVVDVRKGGSFYQMSAAPNAVGPAYQAVRILAGLDKPQNASSDRQPINIAELTSIGNGANLAATNKELEASDSVLSRGTALNTLGLHADASRYLASAIEGLGEGASIQSQIELTLEAALADSNIRFFGSAEQKFDQAEQLLMQLDGAERSLMLPKLQSYRGLHLLNEGNFGEAQFLLSQSLAGTKSFQPVLRDPSTFVRLNVASIDSNDIRAAINLPDERVLRETFLLSQSGWALSVAELSLGNVKGASRALDNAQKNYEDLTTQLRGSSLRDDAIIWLSARLDRQRGRIKAAQGEYDAAIDLFDRGIAALTRSNIALSGTGREPAIAEFQLERAKLLERAGGSEQEIDEAYESAVSALLSARNDSFAFSTAALAPYMNRLVTRMAANNSDASEKYFQAMQINTETGAAKQINMLQNIVSADPALGAKLRDSEEFQRDLSRLSLEINEARAAGADTKNLESQRQVLQQRFFELDAELQANPQVNSFSTRPATIEELQTMLDPGQAYLKLNSFGDEVFGFIVEKNTVHPFKPIAGQKQSNIQPYIKQVRKSIDGQLEFGTVPKFAVDSSQVVYRTLFNDVDKMFRSYDELIVDVEPVLNGVSFSILVSDPKGAQKFLKQNDIFDYSNIEFVANWLPVSVAISPRSFIASRQLTPSSAPQPMIGFASPNPMSRLISQNGPVKVGPCVLTPSQISKLSDRFSPIPDQEIRDASVALGLSSQLAMISGDDFSDTELLSRGSSEGDLDDYKVLHFATHGLTEGQFGCAESPAALLTSFGDTDSDMLLSFDEIAKLRLDANLVVLSACKTASAIGERSLKLTGEAVPGATLEGLVRAFFTANARTVLATYWESSNKGESEMFMNAFYQAGRTESISRSLNSAQRALIDTRETSHPFYWGGFFVVGNSNINMLSGG
ncbi:MAG: CHAT domain-containing protein [Hellea sp.]|nr:CHAT domain-containing protein [Hellea sp.]